MVYVDVTMYCCLINYSNTYLIFSLSTYSLSSISIIIPIIILIIIYDDIFNIDDLYGCHLEFLNIYCSWF